MGRVQGAAFRGQGPARGGPRTQVSPPHPRPRDSAAVVAAGAPRPPGWITGPESEPLAAPLQTCSGGRPSGRALRAAVVGAVPVSWPPLAFRVGAGIVTGPWAAPPSRMWLLS